MTENVEVTLLPCPFCGGEARLAGFDEGYVECADCGATANMDGNFQGSPAEAWNTRAATASNAAMVAELVEHLDLLANREQQYRAMHDLKGDGSHEAGRAWDLMRRAGDQARTTLARAKATSEQVQP